LTLLVLERVEDDDLVEDEEDSFELLELETTTALELEEMDVVVELTVVHAGSETVLLKSYRFNLLEPPQNSDRLPLQSMLHPANPFEARAPPFEMESPQSTPISHVPSEVSNLLTTFSRVFHSS
jgi:hypothetical protein